MLFFQRLWGQWGEKAHLSSDTPFISRAYSCAASLVEVVILAKFNVTFSHSQNKCKQSDDGTILRIPHSGGSGGVFQAQDWLNFYFFFLFIATHFVFVIHRQRCCLCAVHLSVRVRGMSVFHSSAWLSGDWSCTLRTWVFCSHILLTHFIESLFI